VLCRRLELFGGLHLPRSPNCFSLFENEATFRTYLDFLVYFSAEILKGGLFGVLIPPASAPQPLTSFTSSIFLPPKTPAKPCFLEIAIELH